MAEDRIDSIFDIAAIEKEDSTIDSILAERAKQLKAFPVLNVGDTKGLAELTARFNEQQKAIEQLTKTNQAYQKALSDEAKAQREKDAAIKNGLKTQKDADAQTKLTAKATADLSNHYKQLGLAVKDANERYYNLAGTLGRNHPLSVAALKDANDLRNIQKQLAEDTGIYSHSVGNYSTAFTNFALTLRGIRGPTKLAGEALGFSAQEADQFRLIVEHSAQALAVFFRSKEAKATAEAQDAAATAASTVSNEAYTTSVVQADAATDTFVASTQVLTAAQLEQVALQESLAVTAAEVVAATEAENIALTQQLETIGELVLASGGLLSVQQASVIVEDEYAAANADIVAGSILATEAIAAQTAATATALAVTGAQTAALEAEAVAAATAGAILKTAFVVTGVLALAVGIGYLVYKILEARDAADKAARSQKILAQINIDAADSYGKEASQLAILKNAIEDTNRPMSERLQAVKDIQSEYPEYLKNLTDEQLLAGQVAGAYDKITEALVRNAQAHAAEAEIDKIEAEKFKISQKDLADELKTQQALKDLKGSTGTTIGSPGGFSRRIDARTERAAVLQQREDRKKANADEIKDLNDQENIILTLTKNFEKQKKDATGKTNEIADLTKTLNTDFEVYKTYQEQKIGVLKDSLDNDKMFYADKLKVLDAYIVAQKDLINKDAANQIKAATEEEARKVANLQKDRDTKTDKGTDAKSVEQKKRINENIKIEEDNLAEQTTLINAKKNTALKQQDIQRVRDKRKIDAELLTNVAQVTKNDLELSAGNNLRIAQSDAQTLDARVNAYEVYYKEQQELLVNDFDLRVKAQRLGGEALLAAESDLLKKMQDLDEKAAKEQSAIFVSGVNGQVQNQNKALDVAEANDKLLLFNKIKNQKEFNDKVQDLDYERVKNQLTNDANAQFKLSENTNLSLEDRKKAIEKFNEDIAVLDENELKHKQLIKDRELAIYQTFQDAIVQLANAAQQAIFTLLEQSIQRQIDNLQRKEKQADENKNKEIARINQLGLTDSERLRQTTEAEKIAAFQKIQLEEKIGHAKERQAKLQKASNIAGILSGTALAVVNALAIPVYGEILAGIVAALGAIQLGIAIATPIPQYFAGGRAMEGLGIAGERGRELVTEDTGKQWLTAPTATMYKFKGTEHITPAHLTQDILNATSMRSISLIEPKQHITSNEVNTAILNDVVRELRIQNRRPQPGWRIEHGIEASPWYAKHMKGIA